MTESFEPPIVSDASLEAAMLGDTFMVPVDREVPADFLVADGATLSSREYPDFVEALGITGATFTLPEPQRIREGAKYIIKVGPRCELPRRPAVDPLLDVAATLPDRATRQAAARADRPDIPGRRGRPEVPAAPRDPDDRRNS